MRLSAVVAWLFCYSVGVWLVGSSLVVLLIGVGVDDMEWRAVFAEVFQDGSGGAAGDLGQLHEFGDGRQLPVSGVMAAGGGSGALARWRRPARRTGSLGIRDRWIERFGRWNWGRIRRKRWW